MDPTFKPHHMTITHADCAGNDCHGRFWILPGSTGRAQQIADTFLTDVVVRPSERGHNAHLGIFTTEDGATVDVGVMSTGMGAPSVDIIVTELIKMGGKVLVRVGTCGSMCKGLSVGDVVIASGAVRDEGTSRCYMPLEFPALADPCVVFALAAAAQKAIEAGKPDVTWHSDVGVVHTKDSLMSREFKGGPLADDHKKYMTTLEELGCLASEMESSMLFTLGHVHHVKTGCVCGIIGGGEDPFSDDASRKVVATERACQVVVLAMGILKRELCESVRRPSGQAIPLPLHRHLAETRAEATKHLVEAPRSTLQSWSWLLWALGTFFFLGMGNFLTGIVPRFAAEIVLEDVSGSLELALTSSGATCAAIGVCGAILWGYSARGREPSVERLTGRAGFIAGICGLSLALGNFLFSLAVAHDTALLGPISVALSLQGVVVTSLAYAILGERPGVLALVGIEHSVFGLMLMGIANSEPSALWGLSLGLMTALLYGVYGYCLRHLGTMNAPDIASLAVACLVIGATGVLALVVQLASAGRLVEGELGGLLACAAAGGTCVILGTAALQQAVAKGHTGTAWAIAGSNAILVQLLDLFFTPDSSIKFLTFVGMVACIAGMAILSLSGKFAIKAPSDDVEMQDARVQFLK